jgi:citrate synthase
MVDAIGDKERVAVWLNQATEKKEKIMGMGHRVYKVKDPRAHIMERFLSELSEKKNDSRQYEILKEIERIMQAKMEAAGKDIYPNVDFFSGAVYTLLGIPPILFTPIFAIARAPGWLAHILEQRSDNRLYRPKSLYVGPEPKEYLPMNNRQ